MNAIHPASNLKVRQVDEKVYLLVEISVRTDRRKELVGLADGYREWTDSRFDVLPEGRCPEMTAAVRTVVDSGFGFCAASRCAFSGAHERRCWWRQQASILAALSNSAPHGAGTRSGRSKASETSTQPGPPSKRSSSI